MSDLVSAPVLKLSQNLYLNCTVNPTLYPKCLLNFTPESHKEAVDWVSKWWDSPDGVTREKVAEMEAFFAALETRPVQRHEVVVDQQIIFPLILLINSCYNTR